MAASFHPMVRLTRLLLALIILSGCGAVMTGCGSVSGNLSVKVTADHGTDVKPGDTPSFTVSVVNLGPTAATGVSVRVDLPAEFLYKSTTSITGEQDARIQPVDAGSNSPTPVWGLWSLAAPTVNADGSSRRSHVDITFVVDAQGQPGDYPMTPRVGSDAIDGLIAGPGLAIHLGASTRLSMTLLPLQTTVTPGQVVDYRLIVTNDGSGAAPDVGVLVTLPPTLNYQSTVRVSGNSGRSNPVDPFPGALVPFFGGYLIPARSSAGPGILTIQFAAVCVPAATGGTFTASVQLVDGTGATVNLPDVAPVTVNAPTPSPVPRATARPRAGVPPPPSAPPPFGG